MSLLLSCVLSCSFECEPCLSRPEVVITVGDIYKRATFGFLISHIHLGCKGSSECAFFTRIFLHTFTQLTDDTTLLEMVCQDNHTLSHLLKTSLLSHQLKPKKPDNPIREPAHPAQCVHLGSRMHVRLGY